MAKISSVAAIKAHPITAVAKRAKAIGYCTAVRCGVVRFEVHTPKAGGEFDIQPITDWLTAEEATQLLDESGTPCI